MAPKSKTRTPAAAQSYRKPPIIEAVIEFRFAEPLPARMVAKVSKKISRHYEPPKVTKEVTYKLDPEHLSSEVQNEATAFRHASSDQVDTFTVKPASLMWSKLAPYEGWENFVTRTRREMDVAADVIGVRRVARIGLRYVNRIDVPKHDDEGAETVFRYEDYLTIAINLPSTLDPVLAYAWRIETAFPKQGFRAMLQSATLPPELPDMMSFLLDIDVSAEGDLLVKVDEMFAKLSEMRDLKNQLFEMSISDKARQGFQ